MRRHHRHRPPRGQSLVEFALVMPLLVALLVGIFDAGRAVFAYHTINNAAREAGRLAMVDQVERHIVDLAIKQGVSLELVDANVDVAYQLLDGGAPVSPGDDEIVNSIAVVTVTYDFEPVLPLIADLAALFSPARSGEPFGPFVFTGVNHARVEYSCNDAATCPLGAPRP